MRLLSLLLLLFSFTCPLAHAAVGVQPLPQHQAFKISATMTSADAVNIKWQMPKGYYLYRDEFKFHILNKAPITLGDIRYPKAQVEKDETFGDMLVYFNQLNLTIPLLNQNAKTADLVVTYQGCAESRFCYPPMQRKISLNFNSSTPLLPLSISHYKTPKQIKPATTNELNTELNKVETTFKKHNFFLTIFAFFSFGLLLAFTPCILPMLPILSSIIVGHGPTITTGKAFRLSLVYVLSMSFTYAIAGVLMGYLGSNIQVAFQNPWMIGTISLLFFVFAISLFGFIEINLPESIQEKINKMMPSQHGGTYWGVAGMGLFATLVVSPCVTPPLAGALTYIGKTGDTVLGGVALFSLGFGMGIPLLLFGTLGGKILPKAGKWMDTIKNVFAVLMLAIAIQLLSRIIPAPLALVAWGMLLLFIAIILGAFDSSDGSTKGKLIKTLGIISAIYAVILIVGASLGNHDPLKPLANTPLFSKAEKHLVFIPIKNNKQLQRQLRIGAANHRPTLIDFYADWCISCQHMENNVFTRPEIRQLMQQFTLLKVDMTHNSDDDQVMMQHYQVVAPPTLLFFNPDGEELQDVRLVGEVNSTTLQNHLQSLLDKFKSNTEPAS